MTGSVWLDWVAVVAFAAVTLLSLARLVVPGGPARVVDHFHDGAFHAVMGVAMVAMFWPGGGALPGRGWVAVIGLIAVWPVLVFARATRPIASPARETEPNRSPGRAGFYLASALVMVVAFGAGHSSMASIHPGTMAMGALSSPGWHAAVPHAVAAQGALVSAAGWPIWPLIGAVFILYGGWLALIGGRRRQPSPELACTLVMAAGMAFMAFSI